MSEQEIVSVSSPVIGKWEGPEADAAFANKQEYESNMEVIVEYRNQKYRVDFSKMSEEYQLMPYAIKKWMVLEDLKKTYGEQKAESKKTAEQQKQNSARQSIVDRLREKLMRKDPFRKDVKSN